MERALPERTRHLRGDRRAAAIVASGATNREAAALSSAPRPSSFTSATFTARWVFAHGPSWPTPSTVIATPRLPTPSADGTGGGHALFQAISHSQGRMHQVI